MTNEEVVSLREYIDVQFALRDREVGLAREVIDARLGEMNNLRHQIEGERGTYVTQALYDERHRELDRRIEGIELWKANVTGRVVGVGALSVIFTAVATALLLHLVGS